jgi:hypothetical protein
VLLGRVPEPAVAEESRDEATPESAPEARAGL